MDVETKAAEAAIKEVKQAVRKTFAITSSPSMFKTPAHIKHARVKSFKSAEGEEFTAGEKAYRFGQFCRAVKGKADAIEY